jgi:indole-3-glycerol phosphate synthase
LATAIPDDFIKVSESGISHPDAVKELLPYGFKGFLIGENFMKTENPGEAAKEFIKNI